jgi:hypothetical protein
VQLTPPGSACSVQIGVGLTDAAPGSVRNLHLVVTDIEAARRVERGYQHLPVARRGRPQHGEHGGRAAGRLEQVTRQPANRRLRSVAEIYRHPDEGSLSLVFTRQK